MLIGGQPSIRDKGSDPPRMTEFLRGLVVTSGIGQKARDMWRPPDIADVALRPFDTSGIGQNAFEMWRPPRIAEFRALRGDRSRMPSSLEIGPPR